MTDETGGNNDKSRMLYFMCTTGGRQSRGRLYPHLLLMSKTGIYNSLILDEYVAST